MAFGLGGRSPNKNVLDPRGELVNYERDFELRSNFEIKSASLAFMNSTSLQSI